MSEGKIKEIRNEGKDKIISSCRQLDGLTMKCTAHILNIFGAKHYQSHWVCMRLLTFDLCPPQHGQALQHASGAEAEVLRVLPRKGAEGAAPQPDDEDDGPGGGDDDNDGDDDEEQSQVADPLLVLQPFTGEDPSRQESQSPQEYSHAEEHCGKAGVTLPLVGLMAITSLVLVLLLVLVLVLTVFSLSLCREPSASPSGKQQVSFSTCSSPVHL